MRGPDVSRLLSSSRSRSATTEDLAAAFGTAHMPRYYGSVRFRNLRRSFSEFPDQISHPNLQGIGDIEQVHDGHVADAPLDPRDVRPVKVGSLGELLLREAELEPLALDGMA